MSRGWRIALAVGALIGIAGPAHAHELACERALGDERVRELWRYPASLEVVAEVINVHPTEASVLQSFEDARVDFTFALPLPIGVGVTVTDRKSSTVESYEGCLAAAAADGRVDHHIDESFTVLWAFGQAQCTTRITCCSASVEGRCGTAPTTEERGTP